MSEVVPMTKRISITDKWCYREKNYVTAQYPCGVCNLCRNK